MDSVCANQTSVREVRKVSIMVRYTERQWDRTVGYGKVPKEYSVRTYDMKQGYAVMWKPFEEWEYITENGQSDGEVKLFLDKESAEIEANKHNTGRVVVYA